MRFASVALSTLLYTTSVSLAAPVPILDRIGNFIEDLVPGDATFEGVAGAIQDSIQRPDLLIARAQVVKGLDETRGALNAIIEQAPATGNDEVATLATEALAGIETAGDAVDLIGQAILSGQTPDRNDQAVVAEGTFTAQTAINQISTAPADPALEASIADAVDGVALLRRGVDGVLAASDLSFDDLGVVPPELGGDVIEDEVIVDEPVEEATQTLTETAVDDPVETVEATETVIEATETAPPAPEPTGEAVVIEDPAVIEDPTAIIEDGVAADNDQAVFDEIQRLINELKAEQGVLKRRV